MGFLGSSTQGSFLALRRVVLDTVVLVLLLVDLFEVSHDVEAFLLHVICREGVGALLLGFRLVALLTEHFFGLGEIDFSAPVGTREMEVLRAPLSLGARDGGSKFSANGTLLVDELLLLLIEVDDLAIVDVKDFVRPKSTTCVNVHVQFVRDKSSSHGEFTFLLAEEAHQMALGIPHFDVVYAADHRLRAFLALCRFV